MSFSFSQSLLGDISSSYPGPRSQEHEDSQDSGYAVNSNNFPQPPPNFSPAASLPFPPRRTLPRPPTWPNINQPQQGGSRWKFGGRQEVGKSPLERDLQQHLAEISRQVNNRPGKVSTIVGESVKYLQSKYSKEASNVREEIEMIEKVLVGFKEQVMAKDTVPGEMMEKMLAMETGLADCAALVEAVTGRGERVKDKLAGILHKLDKEAFISTKILDEVSSLNSEMNNTARTMVMEVINTTSHVLGDQQHVFPPPSPTRKVSTRPLPSIHRLPTLPLLAAATAHHQGEMLTGKDTHNLGDLVTGGDGVRKGDEREYGRSWRRVRGGHSGMNTATSLETQKGVDGGHCD